MKFTNGYWMIRDGVDALYAREAYELAADATTESLNVLAPTSVVRGRYDTLNLPTFNVDITTPAEGVIRVRAEHWQGATEYPGFPLNADEPGNRDYVTVQANGNGDGEVGVNGADVTLTTGGLTVKVVKGAPWNLTFIGEDGKDHMEEIVKENYYRVKADVAELVLREIARIEADPKLSQLLPKKKQG